MSVPKASDSLWIQKLDLPLELGERLDASVRDEYRRLWQTVRGA